MYLISYKSASEDAPKELFECCWDSKTKKFVYNSEEVTKEGFDLVKGAAKKYNLKKLLTTVV